MSRPSRFIAGIFVWLALELAAFIAVVQTIGLGGALLLGMATSLAGLVLLRQTGDGALARLRSALLGAPKRPGDLLDGLIRALSAFLLILPGFVSDLAGLALAAPSIRQFLARRFGGPGRAAAGPRRGNPEVVDLAPGEWVSIDHPAEPMRR